MPDFYKPYAMRAWVVFLFTVLILSIGCGKKAPPITPRQPAMAAVADLTARYENGAVALAWNHLPSPAAVTGYLVFKARQEEDGSTCKGCPVLFEKADTLPLGSENRTTHHPLSWSQTVAEGFQYTFKVVPVQSSGARGPDSNLVVVEAFK